MANIIGGTCLKCAMGILNIPTADAPTKEANTTPTLICNKVNFKKHPIAPPIHNANNVLGGTLNKIPKPNAAQPHQKALLKMMIQSIVINSNYKLTSRSIIQMQSPLKTSMHLFLLQFHLKYYRRSDR